MKLRRKKNVLIGIILLFSIIFLGTHNQYQYYIVAAEEKMKVLITEEEWNDMDKGLKQIRLDLPNQGTLFYKDPEELKRWEKEINTENYKYTNIIAESFEKHKNEYETTKRNCSPENNTDMILILNKKCAITLPEAKKLIQEEIDNSSRDILNNSLQITKSIQSLGQISGPKASKIDIVLMFLGPTSLILIAYLYLKKIKL